MLAATRPTILRTLPPMAAAITLLCAPGYAETLDGSYAKAKNEKSLVIYAGGPISNYEPLARENSERKFPGLTVSIEGGFSNVLNQKIEQQFKGWQAGSRHGAVPDRAGLRALEAAGKETLAFKPDGFDAIDKSFKDPDGAFIVWYVGLLSYAYNTQQLKPETAPKSALDFLKPEFRGKMIACYPHDDDATLYLFHTLAQKYGADYIDKYLANGPNWVQGHLSVSRSVAAGTNLVTLDATTSTVLNLRRPGSHHFVFSDVDPLPVYYSTAGIFKDAPHPNVAKLYRPGCWRPRNRAGSNVFFGNDVPPPAGLKPLFSYTVANDYRGFVTNERLLTDLRQRFEAAVGPIRNAGGVR
jgi:hypothetical protein